MKSRLVTTVRVKASSVSDDMLTLTCAGTWIAHPLINKIAIDIFNEHMLGPNQYHIRREEVVVTAADLLNTKVPGKITADGVKANISAYVPARSFYSVRR